MEAPTFDIKPKKVINGYHDRFLPEWTRAFIRHWAKQPPEFFSVSMSGFFGDLYERNIWHHVNPLKSGLVEALVAGATEGDLDALDHLLVDPDNYNTRGYARYFQSRLIDTAMKADKEGRPCSAAIPQWFRAKGWGLKELWACEKPTVTAAAGGAGAPAPAPQPTEAQAILKELETARAKVAELEARLVAATG
jgi:hypothetical protein